MARHRSRGATRPRHASRPRWATLGLPLLLAAVVTAAAPGWHWIRVHAGDTVWGLAGRYHTTVAELVALNHLPGNGSLIYAGQLLRVPGGAPGVRPAGPVPLVAYPRYRVQPGDSLLSIAAHYRTDWRWVAVCNHLSAPYLIRIGQMLVIPVKVHRAPRRAAVGSAVLAAAAHDRAVLARYPDPGPAQIRSLVVATARSYGVDPALALAVSYQESGFNQDEVSDADAIGAMQVLPSTGAFVSKYVVGRPLNLFAVRDNVVAGVALLSVLTHAADTQQAVAGYYQGLGSVRARGMYQDTKVYVADVLGLRRRFRGG